jgi:hypothetical protein
VLFFVVYIVLAVVFALIGSEMAKSRNRDAAAWALISALFPLLGILALAVAGKANVPQFHQPANVSWQPIPEIQTAPRLEAKEYDERKWKALLEVDDDVAAAAKVVAEYGSLYLDEFAGKFMALDDKSYLEVLKSKTVAKAENDLKKRIEDQQILATLEADESNKIYLEYMRKLNENGGIDPDYHVRVVKAEKYLGPAKPFKNGVALEFEDGTFALKGGFLMRRFSTAAERDKWGT